MTWKQGSGNRCSRRCPHRRGLDVLPPRRRHYTPRADINGNWAVGIGVAAFPIDCATPLYDN
jgi:hypothetical protein